MFKLIVTDMDGTLVGPSLEIPKRTLNAVRLAVDSGCRITIATGRQFSPTAPVADRLGANAPLILCQGALVQDHKTREIVHQQGIPLDLAKHVLRYAANTRLSVQVHFDNDETFSDADNPRIARMETITGASIQPIPNLAEWLQRPPLKMLFHQRASQLPTLLTQLQTHFGDRLQIVRSRHDLVEITHAQVSKAEALSRLASKLGIDRSEVLAVGDQDNDAAMLRWAGLGVAMNAASHSARAAADVIAPPVNGEAFSNWHDEGVAWTVERYILGWK
jgi:Cof subfamily protein (haloacid dehalogenase superfamily)